MTKRKVPADPLGLFGQWSNRYRLVRLFALVAELREYRNLKEAREWLWVIHNHVHEAEPLP